MDKVSRADPTGPEEWRLDTRLLGRRILVFDCLDSTNTHAASLAHDPANDGLVVLARHQTTGRGQHGRSWQCPPEAGILLSALLFPPPPRRRPALLTAWAAVAVAETIRQVAGLEPRIKWPNDLLVQGKKVCGILIEQGRGTVAGIGLNLNQTAASLAEAGLPLAGSLALFTGKHHDWAETTRTLIRQLDEEYEGLRRGDLAGLETRWRKYLGLVGKSVEAECTEGVRRGLLRDLSFAGLSLQVPGGGEQRLSPEAVHHLTEVEE